MIKKIDPLTESYFFILLCLYKGPNHGYGIMQQILSLSDGKVSIGPGTIYGATNKMVKKGLIRECQVDKYDRKRMYALTKMGRQILLEEINRMELLVSKASSIINADEFEDEIEL